MGPRPRFLLWQHIDQPLHSIHIVFKTLCIQYVLLVLYVEQNCAFNIIIYNNYIFNFLIKKIIILFITQLTSSVSILETHPDVDAQHH